jgi:hypothetical protein
MHELAAYPPHDRIVSKINLLSQVQSDDGSPLSQLTLRRSDEVQEVSGTEG